MSMAAYKYDERRSFLIFLFCVVFTAVFVALEKDSSFILGVLGIFWGFFGFFRLIYLTSVEQNFYPKILSLPSQLLFGLAQEREEKISHILRRMGRRDIVLWIGGGLLFIVWVLFCSFYPAEITIVETLRLKQEAVVDFPVRNYTDPYLVMKGLSFYGVIGIIMFSSLTFSLSHTNLRWAKYAILPVLGLATILTFIFSAKAASFLWVDSTVLKGGGLGQALLMGQLAPEMMENYGTGLMQRFTELGVVGAYGLYILFIPAAIRLLKTLVNPKRTTVKPFIGLLCLMLLAALDLYWISSTVIHALSLLALSVMALCWGAAGPHQPEK